MKLYKHPDGVTKITEAQARDIFKREGITVERYHMDYNQVKQIISKIPTEDLTIYVLPLHNVFNILIKVAVYEGIVTINQYYNIEEIPLNYDHLVLILEL